MEKILEKLAEQLLAYDEASLANLREKYRLRIEQFDGTKDWEKAVIVYCMINAVSLKNTLFNENMLKRKKGKEKPSPSLRTSSVEASEMMTLLPLFVFWGLWYLNFSTRAVFSPLLPLIEDTLSLSHGEAGGLFTSLAIGYSLILLISGRFAAIWGYKRTVVSGFIGIGLVFLGLQWVESYLAFHVLFFFLGIATGTYIPSILPIITETYESRRWGKVLGIHDSAASLSILSIPILVALGLHFLSWRTLLLLLGAASLLLPIYFWKVSVEPKRGMSQQRSRISDLLKEERSGS